jgi:hypothetical protein
MFDYVDITTANLAGGYGGGVGTAGKSILAGTRVGLGKELTDKLFVRLDLGLCQLGQLIDLASSVGAKFEYRLSGGVGISAGIDPATDALLCAQGASRRGFVPTPRQIGADIFRRWRW